MLGILYIILLIFSILFPKSKGLTFLIGLFTLFMFSFVYYSGDLQNYENIYTIIQNGGSVGDIEIGYTLFNSICGKIGLSFMGFRFLVGIFYVTMSYNAVRKFTDNTAIVMSLLLLFPFCVFVSVLRSGIAAVIVLNEIPALVSEDKKDIIKYVLLVIFASLFHRTAIFFLILMLFKNGIRAKQAVILFFGTVVGIVLLETPGLLPQLIEMITGNSRGTGYFGDSEMAQNLTGAFFTILAVGANWIIAFLSKNKKWETHCLENRGSRIGSLQELNYSMSVLMICLVPLLIVVNVFIRYMYMLYALNISLYIDGVYRVKKNQTGVLKIPASVMIAIGVTLFLYLYFQYPYIKDGAHIFGPFIYPEYVF